jgi:hypothetical protein
MRASAFDRYDGLIAVREPPDPRTEAGDVAARIAGAASGGAQLSIDALGSAAGAARALAREGRRCAL